MDLCDIWIRGCYVYKCRFCTFATCFVTYSNATTGNILFFHLKTDVKLLINVLPPLKVVICGKYINLIKITKI